MSRDRLAGVGIIAVASLLWGTTGTAATFAPGVGPLAIAAAAFGVGGLLLAAVAGRGLAAARRVLRTSGRPAVVGAVAVAIYPLAFYSSMHAAGVAIGSVVSLARAPLASGLLEHVVDRRPLGRGRMLAASLGVLGSALLCVSRMTGSSAPASAVSSWCRSCF